MRNCVIFSGSALAACAFSISVQSNASASITFGPIPDTQVVFGSVVTQPQAFRVPFAVTVEPQSEWWLALDPPPFGVQCGYDKALQRFDGTVPYLYNGQTVTLRFLVGEGSMPTTVVPGQFNLIVTPEPTAAAFLCFSSLFLFRRRTD